MSLNEKCGIFAVYGSTKDVSRIVYYGLWALQHRGQENSGITSSDGKDLYTHKGSGLVAHVYNESDLKKLKGNISIGHNRYSTFSKKNHDHSQPVTNRHNIVSLAHNGNLPDVSKLRKFFRTNGIPYKGLNDSEMMHKVIECFLAKGLNLKDAVKKTYHLFTGAFCLVIMTKNELVVTRDKHGIRPLCMGKINGDTTIFSSETCALDAVGAKYVRDIEPGEIVYIKKGKLESEQITKPNMNFDIFEFIYFARPDSKFFNKSVYDVRKKLGKQLGKELNINPDIIIPVPDSSVPAAIGLSQQLNIPLEQVLVKNRYIHRTFIKPSQKQRISTVKMKLNIIGDKIKGKSIGIVDDSIVRGTTSKILVEMLKKHEPKEIHMLITAPPVLYPDFYGINTPKQQNLIAARLKGQELADYIGVTTLNYLSYEGMLEAVGIDESRLCTACFSGKYPIPIGKTNENKIKPQINS